MTMMVSKVLCLPQKNATHLLKTSECHEVPRMPCATKLRDAGNLQRYPKVTPFAELTIGTAIRPSRGRLRTVVNGCGRKRNVERTYPQPPDPQSETGTLAMHSENTSQKTQESFPVHF